MSDGRILVVDNDPQIRRVMRTTLIAEGFEIGDARTGHEAVDRMRSEKYDLLLLDINMPGMTGLETCKAVRRGSEVGIIMLTVRDAEKDKTQAFEAGADDYLTKPFSTPELLARIRAVLRRESVSWSIRDDSIRLGETEVDFSTRRVKGRKEDERLTPKEFELLAYLASHANEVVHHRELLQTIWGADFGDEKEYLRVFINRLRKKIERVPDRPEYLLTEPWVGYRLRLPE
jgi:two-component system KDP operon response regulator KdpE